MRRTAILLLLSIAAAGCRHAPDSPLAIAAAAGRTDEVRHLLAAGADCDSGVGTAITPLAVAARSNHPGVIAALIEVGCVPERPAGSNGWTPLVHAIHKNADAAAVALLDGGATASGPSGSRALLMAAGYGNAAMVRELLSRGADPAATPTLLRDAVSGAWDIDYSWPGCESQTQTVRAILEAAPELDLGDGFWDHRALAYARRKGCSDLVALVTR